MSLQNEAQVKVTLDLAEAVTVLAKVRWSANQVVYGKSQRTDRAERAQRTRFWVLVAQQSVREQGLA